MHNRVVSKTVVSAGLLGAWAALTCLACSSGSDAQSPTDTGAAADTGSGADAGTPPASASVLERNNHPSRDGHFVQPLLTHAAAAKMALDPNFKADFTGAMWASPLYFEHGPNDKGVFIAVTTGNDVLALDETSGAVVWMKNVGKPAPSNGVGCGNIHPLGILATPVIDATTRTIYISAAVGAQVIDADEVHALSIDDGSERPGWPVNVSQTLGFDPKPHNPRSALSLVNGIIYVAYGGHIGDCGDYRGRVVAIDSRDPTKVAGWATSGHGEAIWAAGGMASDGNGVIAVTGNRTGAGGPHQDSEEVVRLTGMANLTRDDANIFYPARWQGMDDGDADFGAISPLIIEVPGATPAKLVVATSKDGHMYFLDPQKLGGMDGHLVDFPIATAVMAIRAVPTAYPTSKGVFVALNIASTGMCSGMASGKVVLAAQIVPGAPVKPAIAWCAVSNSDASPIATTTDGRNDAVVWFMGGDQTLHAVDGESGAALGSATGTCAGVRRWTSPIAVKGRIIVGGDGHLCAWAPTP